MARHNDWPKKFSLGQISFSDRSKEKREIILVHFSICDHDCIFRKSQNLRPFTGEDLVVCSTIRVGDQSTCPASVAFGLSQDAILARHCLLTSRYFENLIYLFIYSLILNSLKRGGFHSVISLKTIPIYIDQF